MAIQIKTNIRLYKIRLYYDNLNGARGETRTLTPQDTGT